MPPGNNVKHCETHRNCLMNFSILYCDKVPLQCKEGMPGVIIFCGNKGQAMAHHPDEKRGLDAAAISTDILIAV